MGKRTPKERPALLRAERYLADRVEQTARAGGSRIPPLREAAALANVSYRVMVEAVANLAQRGELVVRHGDGVYLPGKCPGSSGRHFARPRWQRIADRMMADIRTGRLGGHAPFPSSKELSARYETGYRTVRRAIAALVDQGVLVESSRGFALRDITAASEISAVAFIASGDPSGRFWYMIRQLHEPRVQSTYRLFEHECRRRNVKFIPFVLHPSTGRFYDVWGKPAVLTRKSLERRNALGTTVWTIGMPANEIVRGALRHVVDQGLPVSFLDETAEIPLSWMRGRNATVYGFAGTERCGREVGLYLLRKGHKRIAYISVQHAYRWSHNRLSGLREACASAGLPDGVVPFTAETSIAEDVIMDYMKPTEAVLRQQAPLASFSARQREVARRTLEGLFDATMAETRRAMEAANLYPMLDEALADRTITAWVASTDAVAIDCLNYLRAKGVAVPGKIDLVGFDNSLEALFSNITSYDFHVNDAVSGLVDSLLRPQFRHRSAGTAYEEIPGNLVLRETTSERRRA